MRLCRARKKQRNTARLRKLKREVVNPTRFQEQSIHVLWRRVSPRDNVWNHLFRQIMKIVSQAKGIFRCVITNWCTSLFLRAMKCESSSGQGMEEARNMASMAIGQDEEQKDGYSGSTKRQKESPFCFIEGHVSPQNMRS